MALVTGAGSERGIGREIATLYARMGAAVVLGDVNRAGAEANAAAIRAAGGRALAGALDVTDEDSIQSLVEAGASAFGTVDILVNNAGITSGTKIWELSVQEFDRVLGINLRGGFLAVKAVIPGMMEKRWGRIVWLSSIAGKTGGGVFGASHYAASKAGVIGLCQGIARELGPYGITSNAIAPTLVLTGLVARTGSAEIEQALDERNRASLPIGRSAEPADVAAAALFLASEEASFITGEVMDVNGGAYFD